MKIAHFKLRNFRKIKESRIEISDDQVIFVGANNSGKTSAMDALIKFLTPDSDKKITTTDITLCNWKAINQIGEDWAASDENSLDKANWKDLFPCLDVWIHVETPEIHHVSHLIPSLDWEGGLIGVRMQLEPQNEKKLEKLYHDFREAKRAARETADSAAQARTKNGSTSPNGTFALWPKSMRDFLQRRLQDYFSINSYLLNPASPDGLPENRVALDRKPFEGLLRIDIISAQRGFADDSSEDVNKLRLSNQLRSYYDKHLNPEDTPDIKDFEALEAIHTAQTTFDEKLSSSFKPAFEELKEMNYPGFSNPEIVLTSQINPVDGLKHSSGVQFEIAAHKTDKTDLDPDLLRLPETYNGLGYQNLISMFFQLVQFRDNWLRTGKAGKSDSKIEPLHLILIEEPEAHLHAQAQQVFIKKAYAILQKGDAQQLSTQLIVSTHSSHIAHETEFTSLRYFRRKPPTDKTPIPCAEVVNLSNVFGNDEDTLKFAKRYLKTTHSNLFFADAAILVEGPAERMLVPHFIKHHYPNLDRSYITVLEIGGSHAHRLRPLIEKLGLLTLVVTDLDSIQAESDGNSKIPPERGKKYRTGNNTLKSWIPVETNLDTILDLDDKKKLSADGQVRVAFQCPIKVKFGEDSQEQEAIPYTFEDALMLSNIKLFKNCTDSTGMLKAMIGALKEATLKTACKEMFGELNGNKAEMALDILFNFDPESLKVPPYIDEGFKWLEEKLNCQKLDLGNSATKEAAK